MQWNRLPAIASILMLFLFTGAGYVEYMPRADAIAVDLAPQIGVDEDILIGHLQRILRRGSVYRAVSYGIPWALLSFVLTKRLNAGGND